MHKLPVALLAMGMALAASLVAAPAAQTHAQTKAKSKVRYTAVRDGDVVRLTVALAKEMLEAAGVKVGKTPTETAELMREIVKGL